MTLIIEYQVTHEHHPAPISLCGRFNSLDHFERFKKVEALRGWIVNPVTVKILTVEQGQPLDKGRKV